MKCILSKEETNIKAHNPTNHKSAKRQDVGSSPQTSSSSKQWQFGNLVLQQMIVQCKRDEIVTHSPRSKELIAHELMHVVQQSHGRSRTSNYGQMTDIPSHVTGDVIQTKSPIKKKTAKSSSRHLPPKTQKIYVKNLKKAISLLKAVGFGRAEKRKVIGNKKDGTKIYQDRYDKRYWKWDIDPVSKKRPKSETELMLVLARGKPSEAVDAMFARLDKWSVDCAQFLQVAHWFALRHTYGADRFDRMVGNKFWLRVHKSTGIQTEKDYYRAKLGERMKRYPGGHVETKSVDELIRDAPIGSRIMWVFMALKKEHEFRNENAVKIAPGRFAAHGLGKRHKRNIFTRKEIENRLITIGLKPLKKNRRLSRKSIRKQRARLRKQLFIAQIEHYRKP